MAMLKRKRVEPIDYRGTYNEPGTKKRRGGTLTSRDQDSLELLRVQHQELCQVMTVQLGWERAKINKRLRALNIYSTGSTLQLEALDEEVEIARTFDVARYAAERLIRLIRPSEKKGSKVINPDGVEAAKIHCWPDVTFADIIGIKRGAESREETMQAAERKLHHDLGSRLSAGGNVKVVLDRIHDNIKDRARHYQLKVAQVRKIDPGNFELPQPTTSPDWQKYRSGDVSNSSASKKPKMAGETPSYMDFGAHNIESKLDTEIRVPRDSRDEYGDVRVSGFWEQSSESETPGDGLALSDFQTVRHFGGAADDGGTGSDSDRTSASVQSSTDDDLTGSLERKLPTSRLLEAVSLRLERVKHRRSRIISSTDSDEKVSEDTDDDSEPRSSSIESMPSPQAQAGLPALMGGYFSGSDSSYISMSSGASEGDDTDSSDSNLKVSQSKTRISKSKLATKKLGKDSRQQAPAAPRKNRRGQRERQAIWEKKFRENANHLKNRDETAAATASGRVFGETGTGTSAGRMNKRQRQQQQQQGQRPDRRRSDEPSQAQEFQEAAGPNRKQRRLALRTGGAMASTGANAGPLGSESSAAGRSAGVMGKGEDHPSWAAARRQREMKESVKPMGKKVVF